jgi:hypothetical protein
LEEYSGKDIQERIFRKGYSGKDIQERIVREE